MKSLTVISDEELQAHYKTISNNTKENHRFNLEHLIKISSILALLQIHLTSATII